MAENSHKPSAEQLNLNTSISSDSTDSGNVKLLDLSQDEQRAESRSQGGIPIPEPFDFELEASHLHQDHALETRLASVVKLIANVEFLDAEQIKRVLRGLSDLASSPVDVTRSTAFRFAERVSTIVRDDEIARSLLVLAVKPAPSAPVYSQISALDNLVGALHRNADQSAVLLSNLSTHLPTMFESAEKARYAQGQTSQKHTEKASTPPLVSRPEQEMMLLKAIHVLRTVISNDNTAADNEDLVDLVPLLTKLLRQTTGKAIMKGLLELMSVCAERLRLEPQHLRESVLLICHICADKNSQSDRSAFGTLQAMLGSSFGLNVLHILMAVSLCDPSKSLPFKATILSCLARTLPEIGTIKLSGEDLSQEILRLCESLASIEKSNHISSLIEPLLDIVEACWSNIDGPAARELLLTIQAFSKSDASQAYAYEHVALHQVNRLIILFITCFECSGAHAMILYDILIQILTNSNITVIQLAIMKLVTRLRCDADGRLKIIKSPDTQNLAGSLNRRQSRMADRTPSAGSLSQVSSTSQRTPISRKTSRKSTTPIETHSAPWNKTRNGESLERSTSRLWMYGSAIKGLPVSPPEGPSDSLSVKPSSTSDETAYFLDTSLWLDFLIGVLKESQDWELYSYVIVHLPSQLSNCSLFRSSIRQVSELHDLLNGLLSENTFIEPPQDSGVRKGDVALCLYNALAMLLAYQDALGVRQWNRVVSTFRLGIEKWDRAGRYCMHALAICCYEIPHIISNHLHIIVEMMQKRITQSDLAADILEFLGGLARTGEAYDKTDFDLHQKIFSICIRYLQHSREQRTDSGLASPYSKAAGSRGSGYNFSAARLSYQAAPDSFHKDLHEYIFTIAYQVMIFWFLAIDLKDRPRHASWITQELAHTGENTTEEMEPQSLVLLDMMHRTTFSDLGETRSVVQPADRHGDTYRRTWLMGLSIVTAEFVADESTRGIRFGQFTKRQASGTTHAIHYHNTEETPSHQALESLTPAALSPAHLEVYPNHMIMQLISTISPVPVPLQPILLPENDEFTDRVLRNFDSTDTVDGHKAAVIYIAPSQTSEEEILSNEYGSAAFEAFLSKLGFKVRLKDAKFNTQGLDRADDSDGPETYAWRDRVSEIVFHVPTMMPVSTDKPETISRKKSHIGNDHVKIIYNDSGQPFNTNTFPSDFNSVNIIIAPEASSAERSRKKHLDSLDKLKPSGFEPSATDQYGYYLVQTITADDYPDISPTASPKVVSACGLPAMVRQLALNSSVFCQVRQRDSGGYTSSWLFRLQQIMKLRARHVSATASVDVGSPRASEAVLSPYNDGAAWSGKALYGGLAEDGKLMSSLDFTRWTK